MVAVTPLMIVVTTPEFAWMLDELMIEVEVERPFTVEVRVLTADCRSLELRKVAVVVAIRPLTVDVSVKELVEVDTVRVFDVDEATRLVRLVEVATPLMVVVRVAPDVERAFDVMIEVVAATPFTVVVRTLPVTD